MAECIACGANASQPTYGGLTRCVECTHVWADVEITDERLRDLYGRHYFFGEEYTDYLADVDCARRNFADRLRTLQRFLMPSHQRLFEIGCAYGVFLDLAKERFRSVSGIDISQDAIAYARGHFNVEARHGDLLETDLGSEQYDVVCLWDTVEHLRSPDRFIQKIASHMPPGSVLALTTGDIASLNARLRREHWRLIHPPTHLHYFSQRSMETMLRRLGFDVVHVEHPGNSRRLGSIADAVLRMRLGWDRAGTWMRDSALGRIPVYLNLFDIMSVVATRRGASPS
jgi:2-polyprenyl-3-methyl-5-hydroxy-6-metoxy-1,4-benzoquinol methylase